MRPCNRLLLGLVALVLASPAVAADGGLVSHGRALYQQGCISCHGSGARGVTPGDHPRGSFGVQGAGPSLVGVGAIAADLYLGAGYMPLQNPEDPPRRRSPAFSDPDIRALVAYIASLGNGPPIPQVHPERGSIAPGLELFTENCAGCHQMDAEGGILPGGISPALHEATPTQIAEAVRVGPYLMPRFTEKQLSNRELDDVIAYVQLAKDPVDRGGWGIGHIGPIPEGLVSWLLAGGVLVVLAMAIGERARR